MSAPLLRRRSPTVLALAAAVLLLSGCGEDAPVPSGTLPTVTPSATPTRTQTPSPSTRDSDEDDCLSGRWVLDTADYEAQSISWLRSTGIPLDELEMTGAQRLDFRADSFYFSSDLTTTASVMGVTVGWTDASAGNGTLVVEDAGFRVDDFSWLARPEVPPDRAPAPPARDWSQPIGVRCTEKLLELSGGGSPLVGRFVRS